MSSRREEERNEKIIRGLMKLPPNRRCINCNSLVPQYVCTNFWTFVCTTCGGIHREFTHRVKSVSMAKFTTQELEALQNGGNQRAREIYLKEWDAQNLRLPDDSKPDKIREFIKNVYVNKKYVGGKSTDNASGDVQHLSSHEDENRRASSYHSYSQSPPYDFQYEERRYGKRTSALSRKPGSDRGLYEKHFSSFLSPSRPIDRSPNHVIEDRFAIERSNSRASDCSVSSGGDPFKSDIQSPNFQKDNGSVSSETSREFSSEDLNHLRNPNVDLFSMTDDGKMAHPQRTVSFPGSYGVPNNQLPPSKSNDSSASQSSPPMNFNGLDLFDAPYAPQNVTSPAPVISTSSFPEFPSETPMDLFQPFTSNHVAQAEPPTPALFSEIPKQSPSVSFPEKSSDVLVPSNEGWATFDLPQHAIGVDKSATVNFPGDTNSFVNLDQWPSSQGAPSHGPPSTATLPILPSSQDAPHGPPSTATLPIWPSSQNAPSHGPSSSATLPIWPSSQDAPSHGPPSTETLPIWPSSQNAPSHGPSSSATLPIWPSPQDAPSHGPPSIATLPIWPSSQNAPSHGPSSSATLPIWPSSQDAPSHGPPSTATLPIWPSSQNAPSHGPSSSATLPIWPSSQDAPSHGPPSTATLPIWPSSQDAPSHGPSSSATLPIWPSSQDAPSHGQPSSATHPIWHNGPQSIEEAVPSVASTQVWNAFEDSNGHLQIESAYRTSKEASEFQDYGIESVSGANITPMPNALSQSNANMPQHDFSGIPVGAHSFTFNHVSTNPFDIPYDPAVGYDDVPNLWDMSSLHEALPNGQMPTSFTPAANQPWFSDDPIGPFCPPGSEGGLEFIAGQGSSRQLMNGQTQEPVASVGGNPFA